MPGSPPALFAVGAEETPAFLEQSRGMWATWQAAGNDAALEIAPGADHFSLLLQLVSPRSALFHRTVELLDKVLS